MTPIRMGSTCQPSMPRVALAGASDSFLADAELRMVVTLDHHPGILLTAVADVTCS